MREQGLVSPQDYISMLVWNYKRNAISMDQLSLIKSGGNKAEREQRLLLGSDRDSYDQRSKEEEEHEEEFDVAEI
jgi:hypothetical protein